MKVRVKQVHKNEEWEVFGQTEAYYILQGGPLKRPLVMAVLKNEAEVVQDKVYRIGQAFLINNMRYLLTRPTIDHICLINVNSGDRWSEMIRFHGVGADVSECRLRQLIGDESTKFELL